MSEAHDAHRIEQSVESTFAKVIGRYGTPLLLSAVAIMGWRMYDSLTETLQRVADAQAATNANVSTLQGDLRVVNTKIDEAFIARIRDLERRVELIEANERAKWRTSQ